MSNRHRSPRTTTPASLLAVVLCACGGPGPNDIATPRQLDKAGGSPAISAVVDLGDFGRVPQSGALPAPDSDSVFTVGERILIQGKNFGKQPTISVGGRPATILARIGSGAIVTKIPTGIRTGAADVQVSNPRGRGEFSIEVKRYAFVVRPDAGAAGQVHVLELDRRGRVTPGAVIDLPGARDVVLSADGQIALVAAEAAGDHKTARLALIAVGAAGGPKLVHELRLTDAKKVSRIASAGGLAAIATGSQVILADVREPRYPANYPALDLGLDGAPAVTDVAVNPAGDTLAVLVAEGNQLLPLDVSRPTTPSPGAPLPLLPNERVPLARRLGYDPPGQRIYIIAGDTREALSAGSHPTRMLEVTTEAGALKVARTAELSSAGVPTALAVAPRELDAGSTAVRAGDDTPPTVVATIDRALLSSQANPDQPATQPSALIAAAMAGSSENRADDPGIITDVAFSHDLRFTLATVVRGTATSRELGVLSLGARSSKPTYTKLGEIAADPTTTPAAIAVSP